MALTEQEKNGIRSIIQQSVQPKTTQGVSERMQRLQGIVTPQQSEALPQSAGVGGTKPNFDVVKGALKGIGSTIVNTGNLGSNLIEKGFQAITGKQSAFSSPAITQKTQKFQEQLVPQTSEEKLGYGIEKVAEFLIPASKIANATKSLDILLQGSNALTKVGAKAGLEALTTGAITTGQTGDVKKGAVAGLTAGVLSGAIGGVAQTAKSLGLSEKLYQRIFKNSADDALFELKSTVNQELKKQDPKKYKQLLDSGIIKEKSGQVAVDETLAKKALDVGLKGSVDNMAKTLIKQNYDNELLARSIADKSDELISLEPNYQKTLNRITEDYADAGLGQVSERASELSSKIVNGKISARDALGVRRFLDGMRTRSSFDATAPLPLRQENLKELTDSLRSKINGIPGMEKIMKSYSFNIDAIEALAKEAARRGNNKLISLIDAGIFGGGILVGKPGVAAGLSILEKTIQSPRILTNVGQSLRKLEQSQTTPGGVVGRSLIGGAVSRTLE